LDGHRPNAAAMYICRKVVNVRHACEQGAHGRRHEPIQMTMPISFREILYAFESVSIGGLGEHEVFLCRQTGKIYERSDLLGSDETDELPEDIEDEDKYIPIPDKRELDLGKPLVLRFAREFLPGDFDRVRQIFSKRGAYGRFKDLLEHRGAVDRWHDFESKATERALRDWCEANSIALAD
jgi:hypothetical protein